MLTQCLHPAVNAANYYQHLFIRPNEYEQVIRRGFVVEADSEVYVSVRFNATILAKMEIFIMVVLLYQKENQHLVKDLWLDIKK